MAIWEPGHFSKVSETNPGNFLEISGKIARTISWKFPGNVQEISTYMKYSCVSYWVTVCYGNKQHIKTTV